MRVFARVLVITLLIMVISSIRVLYTRAGHSQIGLLENLFYAFVLGLVILVWSGFDGNRFGWGSAFAKWLAASPVIGGLAVLWSLLAMRQDFEAAQVRLGGGAMLIIAAELAPVLAVFIALPALVGSVVGGQFHRKPLL